MTMAATGRTPIDLFAEAVRATYYRWTALNLAVSYQFGDDGQESRKREEMIQQTISGFEAAYTANKRCRLLCDAPPQLPSSCI